MKKTFTLLPLIIACFFSLTLLGQEVTYSNQSDLIQEVDGFSYEDCVVDVNKDGLDDIVRVTSSGIYIDYQNVQGSAEAFTHFYSPMLWQNIPSWSLAAGDLNNDGYRDFVFGDNPGVSFIFSSENGSVWTEVAIPSDIFSQRSSMNDFDLDGDLDAFVCHDVNQSHMYVNDGSGNMTLDISAFETYDGRGNYANMWVDYDNDGDTDFYLTKCSQPDSPGDPNVINKMYRNNGDGTFTEVGEETNTNDADQSWTTVFEDFNNDGFFDLFTVNHDIKNMLQYNNGDGTFGNNAVEGSGIDGDDLGAWELDAHDFNNDGYVDIITEHNPPLYYNNGDGTFTPGALGFTSGGFGDLNNDGFLDCVRGNTLFMNNGNDNNYVKVDLLGIQSNSDGIGARVEVITNEGTPDEMTQIREVRSGRSFSPMSNLSANFGIGTANSVDKIIVKWPSGIITVLENPAINSTITIPEAECLADDIEITTAASTTICPGESVLITAPEGGVDYVWSNGASSSSIEVSEQGVYRLTMYDSNGCAALSNNINVAVIEQEIPQITAQGETYFCEGGSVILTASEASSYTWSNELNLQSIEVTSSGIYSVTTQGICSEESSEGIEVQVLSNPLPEAPSISGGLGDEITLEASGTGILSWFTDEMLTDFIGTGTSLTVPDFTLEEETTFYVTNSVSYAGEVQSGAKEDLGAEGTFSLPSIGGYSIFDVYEPFTLINATVTASGAGPRTFSLTDANEIVILSETFDLTDGENLVQFNWQIPAMEGLSIRSDVNTMYRNNGGISYPYPIGDVGSIYTSNYGTGYYYYFYDWSIQKQDDICVTSPVAVTASIVGVEEINSVHSLSVYPNPVNTELSLTYSSSKNEEVSIDIMNTLGQVILSKRVNTSGLEEEQMMIDVSGFAKGVYTVRITGSKGETTESFVKN